MSEKSGGVFAQLAKGGFYIPSAADGGLAGVVLGEVEIVRLLASGATSDVWEGVNRTTREPVAVKIACRSDDAALKARFEHEAHLLTTVLSAEGPDAPFPRYHGHGEYEGRPYLVTERLEDVAVPDESNAFGSFLLDALDAVEALHRRGRRSTRVIVRPGNPRSRPEIPAPSRACGRRASHVRMTASRSC